MLITENVNLFYDYQNRTNIQHKTINKIHPNTHKQTGTCDIYIMYSEADKRDTQLNGKICKI